MSYEAMHKVRASGLTDRTQVDVLEALAFFLNKETGACFPSTEAISRISRVNDRLVRTTLKTLRERQKFCVHGIIGARQTGASNEHEHQTQFS